MTPEQLVAILVAISGVLGAVGILIGEIRKLRYDLNGRLSEYLHAAATAARKEGELAGRDYAHRLHNTPSE